jgi:2',3'-cyclic-nucleotide 2'-phosphodiesterase (5'-nucleotidase family)
MKDLLAVQPFGSTVDLVTMKGKHLKQVFEYSVQGLDLDYFDPSGKFLQVSGTFS